MNDYIFDFMAKERKRKLELIDREAWKFESLSKHSNTIAFKRFIKTKKAQKPANLPCCT